MESDCCNPAFLTLLPQIGVDSISDGTMFAIITGIVLIIFSALISGSEIAYFTLKISDIEEFKQSDSKIDLLILKYLKQPEWLLATFLISKNFINIGIVILAAFIIEIQFEVIQSQALKLAIEALSITFVLLFLGEILPKFYASRHSRWFSRLMAIPILVLHKLTYPLSYLLIKSTNTINLQMALKVNGLAFSEISNALELSPNELSDEKEMLQGIVKFGNLYVEEIMTSRVDVIDIDIESDFDEVLKIIIESGYSRIPIFEETPDNIKGILYVKDLLPHLNKGKAFDWQSLIRKAYYVPETKKVNILLSEFKSEKIHMAIVVDEYGGTAGIITLEDILEEIVGDINDEMDEEESTHIKLPDGSYIFEGKTLLNDFYKIVKINEAEESDLDSISGDAETIAGLLLEFKGEIPKKGEVINYKNCIFTVLSSDNQRIKKIKFKMVDNK